MILITIIALILSVFILDGCARQHQQYLYDEIFPEYPPKEPEKTDYNEPLAVILDLGHGGPDKGTSFSSDISLVCEDELAYDVGQKLLAMLSDYSSVKNSGSALKIFPILTDTEYESDIFNPCDEGKSEFFVYPDGKLEEIRPKNDGGLDRRVNTINLWYEHLLEKGFKKDRIVLLSIHFDYAAQNLFGAYMLYPGLIYDQQKRYEDDIKYRHSLPRTWSSLEFGTYLMKGLEDAGVRLRGNDNGEPVYLFQGYLVWDDDHGNQFDGRLRIFAHTPPMPKILLEVANVNNKHDSINIINQDYRQKIAEGLFNGLLKYSTLRLYRNIPYNSAFRFRR